MSLPIATILIVDDDKIESAAIRRSMKKLDIANPVAEARNGAEALDMLRGENGHDRLSRPVVVLLDLNMPCMDGFEFLDVLRRDPATRNTVVFVVTTSSASADRERAYEKHVAGYIVKHCGGQSTLGAVAMLQQYLMMVQLPA